MGIVARMKEAGIVKPADDFDVPQGVVFVPFDLATGYRATPVVLESRPRGIRERDAADRALRRPAPRRLDASPLPPEGGLRAEAGRAERGRREGRRRAAARARRPAPADAGDLRRQRPPRLTADPGAARPAHGTEHESPAEAGLSKIGRGRTSALRRDDLDVQGRDDLAVQADVDRVLAEALDRLLELDPAAVDRDPLGRERLGQLGRPSRSRRGRRARPPSCER